MNGAQDLPNADLVPGDIVLITEWVKGKAFVRTNFGGQLLIQELVPTGEADEANVRPNQYLFGDVVEIVGIDYPWAVCTVHSARVTGSDYTRWRIALDLREFNCRKARPEYLEALRSGAAPAAAPAKPAASTPASSTAEVSPWRVAVLTLIHVVMLVGVAAAVLGIADYCGRYAR